MNDRIQRAVEAMIRAIENGARERSAYLADPHERQADRDEFLKMIDKRRDDTVRATKVALDTEFSRIESTFGKARKASSSYDEAAIGAAWARVKGLLDTFRGVDEIVERESFDRNEAEALRRNFATYVATVQFPDARPVDVERRVKPALYTVLRAELRLMDRGEAEATEGEFERVASADVVKAVDNMAVAAAITGEVPAQGLLEIGYAQNAAGLTPPTKSWDAIVAEVDPEMAAKAARNNLDPAARAGLDENARDVGFRRIRGPEMSGPEAVSRMRR